MQFESYGFDDIRAYIQSEWTFVALVDDEGNELLRVDVGSDDRAAFTSDSGSNPLTAEIALTGQDLLNAGVTLPVTIDRTEVYKTSSDSDRLGYDPTKNATVEANQDEIIIKHDYRIPP